MSAPTPHCGESAAVVETRIVHDVHRAATSLLADVVARPAVPSGTVAELRGFVVTMLRHHHGSEDTDLWPMIVAAAPQLREGLQALTSEHHRLDIALDALEQVPIAAGDDVDVATAEHQAVALRDLVHEHLAHEEPFLFPALRRHVTADAWTAFSARTVAAAPQVGTHFMVAFLYRAGAPRDLDLIFRHLPAPAREALPAMRAHGETVLASLQPVAGGDARTARSA